MDGERAERSRVSLSVATIAWLLGGVMAASAFGIVMLIQHEFFPPERINELRREGFPPAPEHFALVTMWSIVYAIGTLCGALPGWFYYRWAARQHDRRRRPTKGRRG